MKISVEVRSKSWVAGASGFWLSVQVDSWLWVGDASSFVGLGCWCQWVLIVFSGFGKMCFNEFCDGLLTMVIVVVILFFVFCFVMDCGCHGGSDDGGNGNSVMVVIYCIRYIILLYCLYYFNV